MKRFEKMDARELIRMAEYHQPKDPEREARRAKLLRANMIEIKKIKLPTPKIEVPKESTSLKLIIKPPPKPRRFFTPLQNAL
jgi:hypothetical protein